MCGPPNYSGWEQYEQPHGLYDVRPLAGYGHVIFCDVVTSYGRTRSVKAHMERRVHPWVFQGELSKIQRVREEDPHSRCPHVTREP